MEVLQTCTLVWKTQQELVNLTHFLWLCLTSRQLRYCTSWKVYRTVTINTSAVTTAEKKQLFTSQNSVSYKEVNPFHWFEAYHKGKKLRHYQQQQKNPDCWLASMLQVNPGVTINWRKRRPDSLESSTDKQSLPMRLGSNCKRKLLENVAKSWTIGLFLSPEKRKQKQLQQPS